MKDQTEYFARAESWSTDTLSRNARSRRLAWIFAGCCLGVAALEAVALAMLMPLKTIEPIAMLVDRQTGFVQTINPRAPRALGADEALTQSLLAQYVMAREGFDRATLSADYRKVGLWSTGAARASYIAQMPAANPASPLNAHPVGTSVSVTVKSVSPYGKGTSLVRFDTELRDRVGQVQSKQPWIAVVRYSFSSAAMSFADRLVNPLGLQVSGYRRDAEAPVELLAQAPLQPTRVRPSQVTVINRSGQPYEAVGSGLVHPRGQGNGPQ